MTPVQLDQRRLDLRVPADARRLGPNVVADVVGRAAGDRDQLVVAVRARAGDRGLDQVAVGVQLVAPLEVAVAGVRPGP